MVSAYLAPGSGCAIVGAVAAGFAGCRGSGEGCSVQAILYRLWARSENKILRPARIPT